MRKHNHQITSGIYQRFFGRETDTSVEPAAPAGGVEPRQVIELLEFAKLGNLALPVVLRRK